MKETCIFCRIAAGEIPARTAYEDDVVFAFHDIDPRAPVHVLLVPRKHIGSVNDVSADDGEIIGRLVVAAKRLASELGVQTSGYRLVMNCGDDAGQSVDHIHLHLLGGRPMKWPPG
jgi:histidine triad (HIT) family protein